jgi:AcrR family transcriptional regulator
VDAKVVQSSVSRSNGRDKRGTAQHARMSELQRTRIVGAAVDTLVELGYDGITVRQIADRAGVSRKTFYEHFEDRDGCFVAALGERRALAAFDPAGEPRGAPPGFRVTYRTMRVLEAIGELSESHPPSNREVAARAGVADEGQISRLLRRLEGLGLIENAGRGRLRGEANAWRLTDWGVEVRRAVEGRVH